MVAARIDFPSRFPPLLRLRFLLDFGALARFFLALDHPRDRAGSATLRDDAPQVFNGLRAVPLRRADVARDLATLAIDQHGGRNSYHPQGRIDLQRAIGIHGERIDAVLGEEAFHRFHAAAIDGESDHFEARAAKLLLQARERGHLFATGDAPRRPDVEQQVPAAEISERAPLSLSVLERKLRQLQRRAVQLKRELTIGPGDGGGRPCAARGGDDPRREGEHAAERDRDRHARQEHAPRHLPCPRSAIAVHVRPASFDRYTLRPKVAIAYSLRATGFCAIYPTASLVSGGSFTWAVGPPSSGACARRGWPSKVPYQRCLPSRSKNTDKPSTASATGVKRSPESRDTNTPLEVATPPLAAPSGCTASARGSPCSPAARAAFQARPSFSV